MLVIVKTSEEDKIDCNWLELIDIMCLAGITNEYPLMKSFHGNVNKYIIPVITSQLHEIETEG